VTLTHFGFELLWVTDVQYSESHKKEVPILGYSLDDTLLMHRRQAGDPWLKEKDGKAFFDSTKYPELMRK